jgi:hypothetical protein
VKRIVNKREKIEEEIQKTLDQFDHAERLPGDPYFHARVMARLEERGRPRALFPALLRPALLMILVAVNVITAVWYLGGAARQTQAGNRRQLIEVLAEELGAGNDQGSSLFNE